MSLKDNIKAKIDLGVQLAQGTYDPKNIETLIKEIYSMVDRSVRAESKLEAEHREHPYIRQIVLVLRMQAEALQRDQRYWKKLRKIKDTSFLQLVYKEKKYWDAIPDADLEKQQDAATVIPNIQPHRAQLSTGPAWVYGKSNKGLVLATGLFSVQANMDLLCKRLAYYGYCVAYVEMPAHGETPGDFTYGNASEHILQAAKLLKSMGCKKIGVLGHSFGGAAAAFANAGYTSRMEKRLFTLAQGYHKYVSLEDQQRVDQLFEKIKRTILENYEFEIDAIAMITPPDFMQLAVPPWVMKGLTFLPKVIINNVTSKSQTPENAKKAANYMMSVKNPVEYFSLVRTFAAKDEQIKKYLFMIKKTPKLLALGTHDNITGNLFNISKHWRIKKNYLTAGSVKTIIFPEMSHFLQYQGRIANHPIGEELITEDKPIIEILKFFDNHLSP